MPKPEVLYPVHYQYPVLRHHGHDLYSVKTDECRDNYSDNSNTYSKNEYTHILEHPLMEDSQSEGSFLPPPPPHSTPVTRFITAAGPPGGPPGGHPSGHPTDVVLIREGRPGQSVVRGTVKTQAPPTSTFHAEQQPYVSQ